MSANKTRINQKQQQRMKSFSVQNSLYEETPDFIGFNFKYFRTIDKSQSFEDWEKEKILADLMNKLKNFSGRKIEELVQDHTLIKYGNFPEKSKTEFVFPKDLPKTGITWSRFRITGKERLIGFFISGESPKTKNIFYVVYLDQNHCFYKSTQRHT